MQAPSLSNVAVLVTGGAGFIGSHLVDHLLRQGAARVCVLDDLRTGREENLRPFYQHPRFTFIRGDITDLNTCRRACRGMTHLAHLAALGSVPRSVANPLRTHAVNATGFLNLLTAAREAGIRRVVYASSSSVYGDIPDSAKQEDRTGWPLSPYAVTKSVGEQYARVFGRLYGLETIGLRYFNVFGPRQRPEGPYAAVIPRLLQAALEGFPPELHGDGEQTRDFTYVDNVVQANLRALLTTDPGAYNRVFNVAAGRPISLNALWDEIRQMAGTSTVPQYTDPRPGDVRHSRADLRYSRQVLGYTPQVGLREGLYRTYAWFQQTYALAERA